MQIFILNYQIIFDNIYALVYYLNITLVHRRGRGEHMIFDNTVPIYIQIMKLIKKDIILGRLKLGDKVLSTREYAQELKVNPNTMVRVFNELEREGITFTKRGVGTFITESKEKVESMKKEMAEDIIRNFIDGMLELGFEFSDMIDLIKHRLEKEAVQ